MKSFLCLLLALLVLVLDSCQTQQQYQTRAGAMTPAYVYRKGYTARLASNGRAIAPANAPRRIKKAIEAANKIVGKPYRLGGGHSRHNDNAYDCSGSVAFVLREAGMLRRTSSPTSGNFLRWGRPGFGKWLTVYTKKGHVFMIIAGLRFDTTGSGRGVGPRWYRTPRPCSDFKVRHIPGY